MSHVVSIAVRDVSNLRRIREFLKENIDSEDDEEMIEPWLGTIESIILQAEDDGA